MSLSPTSASAMQLGIRDIHHMLSELIDKYESKRAELGNRKQHLPFGVIEHTDNDMACIYWEVKKDIQNVVNRIEGGSR